MLIRLACAADIPAVAGIYDAIHTEEEQGRAAIGWARGVYPTEETARAALHRGDLYVAEEDGTVFAAAIINAIEPEAYAGGAWQVPAKTGDILVLHTLVVDPSAEGRGYGRAFVAFYESLAKEMGRLCLRMDTNEKNLRARRMYEKLGYREIGIVPTVFNGIPGVQLVLLEKKL